MFLDQDRGEQLVADDHAAVQATDEAVERAQSRPHPAALIRPDA
jgi:hypothetical protein